MNIPFEIQEEIIKRVLPVKSLVRFRSVSNQWKSLIDSSEFITHHHSLNQAQRHHLLVRYTVNSENKYVSIADDDNDDDDDDDSFPHHKFSPIVPPTVNQLSSVSALDCSHGLVCLLGCTQDREKLMVFWNPLIRKSVGIAIPGGPNDDIRFGVCPKTNDPKILKITRSIGHEAKAEVFTLSSGAWRSVSMNMLARSLCFWKSQVVIDGVIHWVAYGVIKDIYRICSFDLVSEEFGEVLDFPNNFPSRCGRLYGISKINESLVVLSFRVVSDNCRPKPSCDVWMMLKNGVSKSLFTKLYTVRAVRVDAMIGFRKNGQPVIMDQTRRPDGELEVYEPCSEHFNGLGIYGSDFIMSSYTESLLLLNHSDSNIR